VPKSTDVSKISDPRERAVRIGELIDEHQSAIADLSRLRRETLEELLASGMTQTDVAKLLDMSKGRVSQLLSAGVRPERAFFGTGKLTLAIGTVGLDASNEVVPVPGNVHLNRPNLIVLTNPRLLPFLSQVMEADPHIRYMVDDKGWYLVDLTTATEYRSPRDDGESADYGYVGRLPRPDGKGTFLYLAGLHAPGTLGAAVYVVGNLADLYRDLKARRFSTIVRCEFEPGNQLNIVTAERVTPLYRHEGA
jgi:hypothetical protein